MNNYKVLTLVRETGVVDLEEVQADDWTMDGDNNIYFTKGSSTVAVYRSGYWLSVKKVDDESTTFAK